MYNVGNLLLDGNVFDHNGWNEQVAGAGATIFNHNVYIKEDVTNVVIKNNTFANASSHGLQARSGGDIENNLFVNDPIGLAFGYVNGSPITAGGVSGKIAGNVFVGGRDIAGTARGWAMEVSNIQANSGTTIENNVITGDTQNAYAAIHLDYGAVSNPADAVGINDLTIQNNVINGWNSAIWISAKALPGGTGQYALNGLVVKNNDFQNLLSGQIVNLGPAYNAQAEQFSGNRYYDTSDPSVWFFVNSKVMSLSSWQTSIEPGALSSHLAYVDPTRNIASYAASLGISGTLMDFLSQAENQSSQSWNSQYTASSAIAFVKAGFSLVSQ